MTAMEALQLLNMVLQILDSGGVNYRKFMSMREQANSEGRELTVEELESLASDAQAAIDQL